TKTNPGGGQVTKALRDAFLANGYPLSADVTVQRDNGGWHITDLNAPTGRVYWVYEDQGQLRVFEESKSLFSYALSSPPAVPGASLQIPPAATVGLTAGIATPDLRNAFANHGQPPSAPSQLTVQSAPGGWTLTDRGTGKVYRIYGKSFLAGDGKEDPGDLKVFLDATRLFSTSASKVLDGLNSGVVSKDLRAVFQHEGYTL